MRAVEQTFSKGVVLLAALLSPVQALQGTHAFCSFAGCYDSDDCHAHADGGRSGCGCHHLHEGAIAQQQANASVKGLEEQSHSPCKCPDNCLCKRSPQPRIAPVIEDHVERSEVAALLPPVSDVAKENFASDRQGNYGDGSLVSTSALDACAALCRFTI